MNRLSLSNLFRAISFKQFLDLSKTFGLSLEREIAPAPSPFGRQVKLETNTLLVPEIDFCSATKAYSTFDHGASIRRAMEKANDAKVFERCYDFNDVSEEMWDKAKYVEVTIRPKDPEQAPDYMFATINFKGNLSRTATFYNQGIDNSDTVDLMRKTFSPPMILGDGFEWNAERG